MNNNEGFDNSVDPLDMILTYLPPAARAGLKLTGVNLDDPAVVAQIRSELQPDLNILAAGILGPLAIGFSTAARAATGTAAIFVVCGAISSLLLPNSKREESEGEHVAVMAH